MNIIPTRELPPAQSRQRARYADSAWKVVHHPLIAKQTVESKDRPESPKAFAKVQPATGEVFSEWT
jgi:hypothetical protein